MDIRNAPLPTPTPNQKGKQYLYVSLPPQEAGAPSASISEAGPKPGISRWHTRVLQTQQRRTVPIASIQLRAAGGFTGHLMAGSPTGHQVPLWQVAWPTTHLGVEDPFTATRNFNSFDDIIEPQETRPGLAKLLHHLQPSAERRASQSEKKHTIDTW